MIEGKAKEESMLPSDPKPLERNNSALSQLSWGSLDDDDDQGCNENEWGSLDTELHAEVETCHIPMPIEVLENTRFPLGNDPLHRSLAFSCLVGCRVECLQTWQR